MDLLRALAPMPLEEFRERFFGKKPFALVRKENLLEGILTLAEIEARLNDGCASLVNLAIIGLKGEKLRPSEVYEKQSRGGWNSFFLRKEKVRRLLEEGHSFVMHNLSLVNREIAELTASIESTFPGYHADLHLYVSPAKSATAYNVHRDYPQHKIYLQLLGSTSWTVFKGPVQERAMNEADAKRKLSVDFQTKLTPGSVLYMPPNTYHRATNDDGPRVSLSIPFHHHVDAKKVDCTHIPFRAMFETATRSSDSPRRAP